MSHRVANGHAGTDPLVKARAPVLGAADQHRSGCLERRAHPVRARRPLRPARPRRHVAVPRAAQRLLVALDGQNPTRAVGDGDDAADALDLVRDRCRRTAELGEHDLVLERVLGGRFVLRGRRRRLTQTRVDVVLLAAAIPRRGDFGPDAPDTVVPSEETFARCGHRSVPLRVTHAMTPCGLAHLWDRVYAANAAASIKAPRSTQTRVRVGSRHPVALDDVLVIMPHPERFRDTQRLSWRPRSVRSPTHRPASTGTAARREASSTSMRTP